MNRGMTKAMEKVSAAEQADPGAVLKTVAMALVSSVGGAAGPLYGTLFLQMGSALAGQDEVDLPAYAAAWRKGLEGVQARGKAVAGDKTMVDALIPAVEALEAASDLDGGLRAAAQAAEEGMKATIAAYRAQGARQLPGRTQQGPPGPGRDLHLLPLQERRRGARGLKGNTHGEVLGSTRSGDDQLAGDGLRPRRPCRGGLAEGARADLSQAGLGRARPEGDLGTLPGGARRGDGEGRRGARRHRRARHHQPARDRGRVGPQHRRAGHERDRLAGHPDRQARRRAVRGRRSGPLPHQGRPAAGDLLLRPEGPLDPRQRRRRAREGRGRRPDLRQHRHVVHLEPDRRHQRRSAHHRRDERQPDDADGPRDARLGCGHRGDDRRADVDAAGDQCLERGLRRGQRPAT